MSSFPRFSPVFMSVYIQVFRERLSEKVDATTPKGIVGSFECPVLQRNLKELHGRPRTYVCECQRKVKKLVLTATVVRNSVLIISHITFRDCRVHIFCDNLSRNSCIPWVSSYGGVGSLQGSSYICISVKLDPFCYPARDRKSPPQRRNVPKYFRQRSWFGEKFVPQTAYLSSEVNKYTGELWFGSSRNTLSRRAY